jgi:hypothetical protein
MTATDDRRDAPLGTHRYFTDAPLDIPLYPHGRRLSVGLAPTASARRAAVARLDRTGR